MIENLFNEYVSQAAIVNFVGQLSAEYSSTEKTLLRQILSSRFIHVDETKISIHGTTYYVWVLTDGSHVVFRLTDTRETTLIQQIIDGYSGVLVSDFYGGYDAVPCRQQKCLVHLIRDLNDDLWKHPFHKEYERFVVSVRDLLVPIFDDVGKYGLKTKHLQKHAKEVDRFYNRTIEGEISDSEVVLKYQKRFLRYRESLFRFLFEDGIPWNNNNTGERAIRHLAIQRKISGSFYKPVTLQYLLLLGIAQTCRFQGKSFLRFMLSGEKDLDNYIEKKQKRPTRKLQRPTIGSGGQANNRDAERLRVPGNLETPIGFDLEERSLGLLWRVKREPGALLLGSLSHRSRSLPPLHQRVRSPGRACRPWRSAPSGIVHGQCERFRLSCLDPS